MLGLDGGKDNQNLDAIYEMMGGSYPRDKDQQQSFQAGVTNKMRINNFNWHDQHTKSELDSKITPLC